MDITEQLDSIHNDFPQCEVVAFADLSAGLVLRVNSDNRFPQEQLDALCATAMEVLDGAAARAFQEDKAARPDEGVALTRGRLEIFLRSATAPEEALCCSCDPGVDVDALVIRGRAALAAFGSEAGGQS